MSILTVKVPAGSAPLGIFASVFCIAELVSLEGKEKRW
jgi:hypothetical protein